MPLIPSSHSSLLCSSLLFWTSLFFRSIPPSSTALPSARPLVDALSYDGDQQRCPSAGHTHRTNIVLPPQIALRAPMLIWNTPFVIADYARYAGAAPLRNWVSKPRCWFKAIQACRSRIHSHRLLDWTFRPSPSSSLIVEQTGAILLAIEPFVSSFMGQDEAPPQALANSSFRAVRPNGSTGFKAVMRVALVLYPLGVSSRCRPSHAARRPCIS
ncbi:hypothetical protein BJ912DRAFT_1054520 [Pholiota molesta]|nr:hypothetical protein BJ912DRAFT_1054520 [Pholiota molesta]